MADQSALENPDAAGMAIATGSSTSMQNTATNRRNNRSSDNDGPVDTAREESPAPLDNVAIDAPDTEAIRALEQATAHAVGNLDRKFTTRKMFSRVSGTWKANKVLMSVNLLYLAVMLAGFGFWAGAGGDLSRQAAVTGLCAAMMLLSLALENLSAVLTDHVREPASVSDHG